MQGAAFGINYYDSGTTYSNLFLLTNGGAATFSSSVQATKVILSGGSDQSELTNSVNNDFKLTNSGNFRIVNNANTVALLTVSNTGTSIFNNNANNSTLNLQNNSTYNANLRLLGSGQSTYFLDVASGTGQHWIYGSGNVDMAFGTNGTERMRITSGGNVGIGTSIPTSIGGYTILSINNASNSGLLDIQNNGTSVAWLYGSSTAAVLQAVGTTTSLTFQTNSAERMRITSGGDMQMASSAGNFIISNGSISNSSGGKRIQVFGSDGTAAASLELSQIWNGTNYPSKIISSSDPAAGGASSRLYFQTSYYNGSGVSTNTGITINYLGLVQFNQYTAGTLSTNSSGVISASDARYKIKTRDIENGIDTVMKLTPKYYKWKSDSPFASEYEELGFFAQEIGSVIPEASPEPETDKFKNYHDRAIIAMLTKAIQEQQAQIEELKNKLNV